jgi:hypothetical protein
MKFNLYISPCNYSNFVSYLEFKLHTRQLICGNISYRDIDVLSQSLNPEYVKRLQLNMRPFQAMILLLKQATSILALYTMTIATVYLMNRTAIVDKEQLVVMIMGGLDILSCKTQNMNIY